ncbi:tellurite resistance TerB family protein [Oryzicola mucosus]|uniref:TerB family tellurite resistance protein n=1 Tax=Oryzicola mucosus TaxID=2767425 RepID=A0A8J6PLV4_9HYPH|nr:TerB family tellurite resistance protein [Oryzicola mucosus]MBD0413947.1 TerB family tellurite resistance protein [Oryzicola mucosus]
MLDRVFSVLKDLPGGKPERGGMDDDPRLAVAALMYHVMDADGRRQDSEWESIKHLLAETYGIKGDELKTLIREAVKADQEAIDLYAFTSPIKRHLDAEGRKAFIAMLWDVVYADGVLHEMEDNIIWRVAELIGVDSRDRVEARRKAAASYAVQHPHENKGS